MAGGSLNLGVIVESQSGGVLNWFWIPLFPLFIVYFISGVAETNRHPFDVAEGESEIVAGFNVEYSGIAFGIFFCAEYANMILIATLTSIMFLGGWESFFAGTSFLNGTIFEVITEPNIFWLAVKVSIFLFIFFWLRASLPRYRYDQIMKLGWKVLVPITILWIGVEGAMYLAHIGPWKIT